MGRTFLHPGKMCLLKKSPVITTQRQAHVIIRLDSFPHRAWCILVHRRLPGNGTESIRHLTWQKWIYTATLSLLYPFLWINLIAAAHLRARDAWMCAQLGYKNSCAAVRHEPGSSTRQTSWQTAWQSHQGHLFSTARTTCVWISLKDHKNWGEW